MIRMKSLRSFGVVGANEGKVRRGREFVAANEHRVKELEVEGLAYRVAVRAPEIQNKVIPIVEINKAAETGPLDLAGGAIGAEAPAPSSQAALRRRRRRSKDSAVDSRS